ncbi:hypothetical protein ACFORL_00860 [Legionella dresdenensis]|uniref:Flagellar assembly protein FliH/Type III secretion system HrpE domain-containing protein n=1 Tax=Legionella dresdenensis TaxID=450200 RepID=A0ABV8CBD8_9GAMM
MPDLKSLNPLNLLQGGDAEQVKETAIKEAAQKKSNDIKRQLNEQQEAARRDAEIEAMFKAWGWKKGENGQVDEHSVEYAIREMKAKAMEGYSDWVSGMMDIVKALEKLNIALAKTYGVKVERGFKFIWQLTMGKVIDAAKTQIGLKEEMEIEPLSVTIEINNDNKLVVSGKLGSDDLEPQHQQLLKKAVESWFLSKGYMCLQDNSVVNVADRQVLTAEQFNVLNQDDEQGLNAFLSGRFKMEVKQELKEEASVDTAPTPLSTRPF